MQSLTSQVGPADVQIITRLVPFGHHFISKRFRDPDSEPEPGKLVGPAAGGAAWVGGQVRGGVKGQDQGRVLGCSCQVSVETLTRPKQTRTGTVGRLWARKPASNIYLTEINQVLAH